MYFQLLRDNAKADDFFWFLVELHRELKYPLIVVWDRVAAHRKAARWLSELEINWIQFEYFPAYCPELDPLEHVRCTTKWGRLANWPAPNLDELEERVREDLESQSANQQQLKRHFAWAGLDLD